MGVDLVLEGVQLTFVLGLLLLHHIRHEFFHLLGHGLHRPAQPLNLIGSTDGDFCIQISVFQLLHRLLQLFHWAGNLRGHRLVDQNNENGQTHHADEARQLDEEHVVGIDAHRGHSDNLPPSVSHRLNGDHRVLPIHLSDVVAVLLSHKGQAVLFKEVRVHQLLAGMVDHLPVLPHQVGVTGVPVSGVVENLLDTGEVDV